jgi:hypothetical protein
MTIVWGAWYALLAHGLYLRSRLDEIITAPGHSRDRYLIICADNGLFYLYRPVHVSKSMFYPNMNRHTRTGEQFSALMHRLHFLHYVYWGCPIALGQRNKAIG